jgi:osmotically-inducible protein OsmY
MAHHQSHGNEPAEYLAERVRQALVEDPRTAELDVQVELVNAAETIVLTGCVATPERRRALEEVAREVLPDRQIDNRTVVGNYPESHQTEHLS